MPGRANRTAAIVVGAGQGIRMGTRTKKQYMMLGDRPVLAHTLLAFEKCELVEKIFLVIPEGDDSFCQEKIIDPLKPGKPICLVPGGPTRQASVYHALKAVNGKFDLVVIHDAVRPFIEVDRISVCVKTAEKYGGCIVAAAATDTVKTVDEDEHVLFTMKRHRIRMAQTPQAFHYDLIFRAHEVALKEDYLGTDDAELVERVGGRVKVISGHPYNIKITTPEDLKLAQALLSIR
jgi:2-C-methyl-D-erythritol 4-phosphate cytidylyltransferase